MAGVGLEGENPFYLLSTVSCMEWKVALAPPCPSTCCRCSSLS